MIGETGDLKQIFAFHFRALRNIHNLRSAIADARQKSYTIPMQITKPFIVSICLGAALLSPSAFGDSSKTPKSYLTGDALRSVFEDTTMSGEYRTFRGETQTFRYTEYHDPNGTSDYTEGDRNEPGVWYILGGDKICYRYPQSKRHTRTYCFVVYNFEGCYYKFSQYDMTPRGPRHWDLWTSRAVRQGHGGSCEEPIS